MLQVGVRRRSLPWPKRSTLRGNYGQIVGETIGDARLLFADDIASIFVLRAHIGRLTAGAVAELEVEELEVFAQVHIQIEQGIAAFVQFANGALDRYIRLAVDRGAAWEPILDERS